MRTLLFSPVAGRDDIGGDTSYTEALLEEPPNGVVYTTYADALAEGSMVLRGRRPGRNPTGLRDLGLFGVRAGEFAARRSGLMFAEPLWFATIDPDAFDLVHVHLFSLRQVGTPVPVVSSAGYPLSVLYQDGRGWSARRTTRALSLETLLAHMTHAHVPWLTAPRPDLLTVYSGHFAQWMVGRGIPEEQVRVLGTALPAAHERPRKSDGRTLALVARDYQRKGGDVALAAFDLMRQKDPSLTLLVATQTPEAVRSLSGHPGVELFHNPPRTVVLEEILPRTDVLLAPTRLDCGVPYGLLEALRQGCGLVTSTVPWLDERLTGPSVRRVDLDAAAVASATSELLEIDRDCLERDARALWQDRFSMASVHHDLLAAYRDAMAGMTD
jgi:glycosyltransferase involved in cell wall biosynthesis